MSSNPNLSDDPSINPKVIGEIRVSKGRELTQLITLSEGYELIGVKKVKKISYAVWSWQINSAYYEIESCAPERATHYHCLEMIPFYDVLDRRPYMDVIYLRKI